MSDEGAPESGSVGWAEAPAPSRLTGLWRRLSIELADVAGDIDAFVVWLQTRDVFVDLRIPPRPEEPAPAGFDELGPAWIAALTAQEGFAGRLLWAGDRIRWPRALDFRPLGKIDEGRAARSGRILVETGAGYVEHWWQLLEARAGPHVMFAEDRRAARPLPGEVEAAAGGAGLAALLDCEVSYGRLAGDGRWRVERSTLPWLEGETRVLPGGLA